MLLYYMFFLFTLFSIPSLYEGEAAINSLELLEPTFEYKLATPLQRLDTIIFVGVVHDNANSRFEVNFMVTPKNYRDAPDIAFQISPRFGGKKPRIALNSWLAGNWEEDIDHCNVDLPFPFQFGHPFFLEIYMERGMFMPDDDPNGSKPVAFFRHKKGIIRQRFSKFLYSWPVFNRYNDPNGLKPVAVNGWGYCYFSYRVPLKEIASIQVTKGLTISQAILTPKPIYPSPMPEYLPCPALEPVNLYSSDNGTDKLESPIELRSILYPQSSLIIQGEVKGIGFSVSLQVDHGENHDIAFHFNPRLSEGYTALNSRIRGVWGTEERKCKKKFPFQIGFPFYLEIFVCFSKFMVAVNGEHYYSFNYRIPAAKVTSVLVEGGVTVRQILTHTTKSYPSPVWEFEPQPKCKGKVKEVWTNIMSSISMMVPFVYELKTELRPQSSIFIGGVVNCRSLSWDLELMKGSRGEVGFLFQALLWSEISVLAALLDSKDVWVEKEDCKYSPIPFAQPFLPGQTFWMEIFLTETEFKIAVDGVHLCSYKYRVPLCSLTSIKIAGVKNIYIDVQPVTSYPSTPPFEVLDCAAGRTYSNLPFQISPLTAALYMNSTTNSCIEM